jgi:hypothetical protein
MQSSQKERTGDKGKTGRLGAGHGREGAGCRQRKHRLDQGYSFHFACFDYSRGVSQIFGGGSIIFYKNFLKFFAGERISLFSSARNKSRPAAPKTQKN